MPTLSVKAQLAREAILKRIVRGRMKPGDRIPSEMQLASELKMNHQTVRRGLAQLVDEGVIVKQPGVGNFVKPVSSLHVGTPVAMVLPTSYLQMRSFSPAGFVYEGVSRVLEQSDYNISVLTFKPWRLWEDAGKPALDRGIQGVLVSPSFGATAEDIVRFKQAGIPMVMLSYAPEIAGAGVGWVDCDHAAVLLELVQGLLDRGHRRIAVFRLMHKTSWGYEESVVRQAYANRRLKADLGEILIDIPDTEGLDPIEFLRTRLNAMFDLVSSGSAPTAIIVPDELIAIEAFRVCYARGLRVPQDVAIAALEDHAPHLHPVPLTAVNAARFMSESAATAARELVKLLDEEIRAEDEQPRGIVLPVKVEWKASTGELNSP